MGLLTDPSTGQGKFTKLLIEKGGRVCVLIYLAGIVWFLWLPHKSVSNATYFSENALLPGLVRGEFNEDLYAKKLHTELRDVMEENPTSFPYEWLTEKFTEMHLDSHLHNFTLDYPLSEGTTYYGQNLYAVLRASRSSSIEGIVVTAAFRTLDSVHPDNTASIAIMLALAKYCRQQKYWAKDIVFLITDHEQLGTQAWLEAYHSIQSGNGILKPGEVVGRAGSLQAAINLELHSTKMSHIDVKVEGLNGQLPNLDLVNLVHRLCSKEGIKHTFKNRTNPRKRDTPYEQWQHSMVTLMSMVLTQASGVPQGSHGLYHRFGIEAVTLEGYEPPANYKQQVSGLYQVGRVLEGILRSLNNLLERFHQSYFFYLLPCNDRFISIGLYMPAVGLIGLPLLVKALTLWLQIYDKIKELKHKKPGSDETLAGGAELAVRYTRVGSVLLGSHVLGLVLVKSGTLLAKVGAEHLDLSPQTSVYVGWLLLLETALLLPRATALTRLECDVLNILTLLELATLLLTIAMHNFSLALLLAAVYVPLTTLLRPKTSRKWKVIQTVCLLLINPFVLVHVAVLLYTYVVYGDESWMSLLGKSWSATCHSFVYMIMDSMIYGNWFLEAVFGFLLPVWLLFWTLVFS